MIRYTNKNKLVANQKGGVGKSLIADELAWSFERSGIPTGFVDLDAQGGTCHETHQPDDARITIIDTPGALQADLRDWISGADLIVIPTRPTSRDIEPLQRMMDVVQAAGRDKPTIYIVNGYNRFRASSDFFDWFKPLAGKSQIAKLPQSETFVQASAAGVSVVQYARHSSAARATVEMCNLVRRAAGFRPEK